MGIGRLALMALLALAACVPPRPAPVPPRVWPSAEWQVALPEEAGVRSAGLAGLLEAAHDQGLPLHSLLVVRHGALVLEAYADGYGPETLHDIASCTKSVTATLVGIALGQGLLPGLDAPLAALFPGRETPAGFAGGPTPTLRHLLTMSAGLECVTEPTEMTLLDMVASPDWLAFALARPAVAPAGARWCYDSVGSHLLSAALSIATGRSAADFAREHLFAPLGIRDFRWTEDPQGRNLGGGDLRLRPRDMARLGLLYLHGGRWDGRQLLPEGWVAAATARQAPADGPAEGYGFQWWLAPDGFFASGRGGQFIYVSPAADLVVVTTAGAPRRYAPRFGALLAEHLAPALSGPGPLPPDPAASARLASALAAFAAPPSPAEIPHRAMRTPHGRYVLDENALGWRALSIDSAGTELWLTLEVDGAPQRLPVGLDGVPRVSEPVRFSTNPRHEGASLALRGRWEDRLTFVLDFDTRSLIDRGTATFHFDEEGRSLRVTVLEETFVGVPMTLTGRAD